MVQLTWLEMETWSCKIIYKKQNQKNPSFQNIYLYGKQTNLVLKSITWIGKSYKQFHVENNFTIFTFKIHVYIWTTIVSIPLTWFLSNTSVLII